MSVLSPLGLLVWLLFGLLLAMVAAPSTTSLRERFIAFDDTLAALGVPPLTAWWREGIGRWLDAYERGQVLELWVCCGRGAAKSTALYKLALFFLLFGDFVVPVGERHFAIVLSRLKEEAAKGIDIIAAWLTLLGIPHHLAGDVIELDDMPRGIRVVAASVAATSGWRAFFVGRDERGKWPLSGLDERDGEEIDTSAKAMTATHANAPLPTFGSAWIALGPFHETIAAGSTPSRVVLGPTPTWVAAPHITEADCRRKEPNPKRFAREYGSIADAAHDEAVLEPYLIDRAMRTDEGDVPPDRRIPCIGAMDPSLGRNAWTFVIAGPRTVEGRSVASVMLHREWRAPHGQPLDIGHVLEQIAGHCRAYGVDTVVTDQFHAESLSAIADKMRLGFEIRIDKAGAAQKVARWENLAMRFLDDAVELPRDRVVKSDLLAVRRRVSGNAFTISMAVDASGRHADFSPSIALALERVAVEDSEPEWVRAMSALRSGGAPDRPPVAGNARGGGRWLLWGCPPAHHSGMTAEFSGPGAPATYSREASEAFKHDVQKFRQQKGI
jgi:hypothetical protein